MTGYCPAYLEKIVNPDMARAALRNAEPHGEFKAFVRLAKPEDHPSYMRSIELHSAGLVKARIPCNKIAFVAADTNVISIELREHISSSSNF
jgi:hypothetical protein